MKIACLVIPIVLCVFLIIVPVFELVAIANDLDFTLYSELVIPIIQTVLAVGSVIAIYIMKPEYGFAGKFFCNLLTPIALLNAICFVDCENIATVILAIVWSACVFAIYLKFVPDSYFKAASSVFSVILSIAFVVLYLVVGILGDVVNTRTVSETIQSPNGQTIAEISTVNEIFEEKMEVRVYPAEPKTRALIGAYTYKEVSVYKGEAHEALTADIQWKDDSTLIVNETEYEVVFE